MSKKKTIIAKNSMWARTILQQKFFCRGFEGGCKVSSDKDNKEYLMVLPEDEELIDGIRQYTSCTAEDFHRYYEDNSHCEYVTYVDEFINKVKELYGE